MAYKQIESLQQYIIIHQSLTRLDVFRKDAAGQFSAPEEITGGSFTLDPFTCGPLTINVESVYEGGDWGVSGHDGTVGVAETAGELSW